MNKICTTIEQSKKLIELGIDVNTADMYYQYYKSLSPSGEITKGHRDIPVIGSWKEHHISIPDPAMPNADIPAWSLSALLGLIPKPLLGQHLESEYWECTAWEDFNVIKEVHGQDNPLDAAFEMVVWLKENGKI